MKGNRQKNFKILTIFTITLELAIFKRENQKERQKERADNYFDKTKNYLRWILNGNRPKIFKFRPFLLLHLNWPFSEEKIKRSGKRSGLTIFLMKLKIACVGY